MALHEGYDESSSFPAQVGLAYVRGCEVEGMLDNEGKVIEEGRYHCDDEVVKLYCILRSRTQA